MPRPKKPQEYICTVPCWHGGKKYWRGRKAFFGDGEGPRDKAGKIIHFNLANPELSEALAVDTSPLKVNNEARPMQ